VKAEFRFRAFLAGVLLRSYANAVNAALLCNCAEYQHNVDTDSYDKVVTSH
jgi:hypothetical protein